MLWLSSDLCLVLSHRLRNDRAMIKNMMTHFWNIIFSLTSAIFFLNNFNNKILLNHTYFLFLKIFFWQRNQFIKTKPRQKNVRQEYCFVPKAILNITKKNFLFPRLSWILQRRIILLVFLPWKWVVVKILWYQTFFHENEYKHTIIEFTDLGFWLLAVYLVKYWPSLTHQPSYTSQEVENAHVVFSWQRPFGVIIIFKRYGKCYL